MNEWEKEKIGRMLSTSVLILVLYLPVGLSIDGISNGIPSLASPIYFTLVNDGTSREL